MLWFLDVHFGKDFCRIEEEGALNAVRKVALGCMKTHRQKTDFRLPLSKIMFGCQLDCEKLISVLMLVEN